MKLKQAGIHDTSEEFVKKTAMTAFYMTTGIEIFLFFMFMKFNIVLTILYIIFPLLFILFFLYFIKLPDVRILKAEREINKEIVFAGRFLIIELESGVDLYNSLKNVSYAYPKIGKFFREIIEEIDLGTSTEEAINLAVEFTPSDNFRKMLWQILNSLKTGADISSSLSAVIDQITREQIIEVKRYGRKLNPLAMFYMIIAVILPSIGTTMMIVISSFVDIHLNLTSLLLIASALGFMQFMFIAAIKSSRPAVAL